MMQAKHIPCEISPEPEINLRPIAVAHYYILITI